MSQVVQKSDLLEKQKKKFAEILGTDGPVSDDVFFAAVVNQNYANDLLITRNNPKYQKYLLDTPPSTSIEKVKSLNTAKLLASAAKSLIRWAKTGFSTLEEQDPIFQARISACVACPNLRTPPSEGIQGLLYKAIGKNAICGKCGCPIATKIRLTKERCPDIHPEKTGVSRWGDEIPKTEKK